MGAPSHRLEMRVDGHNCPRQRSRHVRRKMRKRTGRVRRMRRRKRDQNRDVDVLPPSSSSSHQRNYPHQHRLHCYDADDSDNYCRMHDDPHYHHRRP